MTISRPVGPGGNIHSTIANNQLGVFDSSGNLLRSSFFNTLTAPNVGSDGTIYVGENFPTNVMALNPDLSVKWKLANSIGYLVGPVVDSSNTLVVVGANGIGGVLSAVQGIDAATGTLSWQVDLPAENGGFVRPMSRPRFSLDAATVYVGMDVNDNAADPYTYLYAIDTGVDGGGGGIPCGDLVSFQVRCKSSGGGQKLQAQAYPHRHEPLWGAGHHHSRWRPHSRDHQWQQGPTLDQQPGARGTHD